MKKIFLFCAAAGAAALLSAPASAAVIFNLVGVTLQGGGTLTGSFTTNDALTAVTAVDITASAGSFGGFPFTAYTYNSLPSFTLLPLVFDVNGPNAGDELRIAFAGQLTASGATLANSYDYRTNAGPRAVTAGSVVAAAAAAVPEPATWAMMIVGFGMAGAVLRRRRPKATLAAA
jgi:hypothetical protein